MQISKINTQLTSHLAGKTKLQETLADLNIKHEILDKQNDDINGELSEIKKILSSNNTAPQTDLIECRLDQLQTQIMDLA